MGRRNRERRERIERGEESPLRHAAARAVVKLASRGAVIEELSRGTVDDQVGRLNELTGTGNLQESKLKKAIVSKAPSEMDKGIKKLQKQGREVTVYNLLSEVRSERSFLSMCERLGLDYSWFEKLARERMKLKGLEVKEE